MAKAVPFPHVGYNEPSHKRVRVVFGGEFIVDTTRARLVWEHTYYPTYYFLHSDVPNKLLQASSSLPRPPESGTEVCDLVHNGQRAPKAAILHRMGPLAGLVKIIFDKADAWFEEEEEIFVHPKDPYKRVDVLQSARRVRVELEGTLLADTLKPRLLFETGLPVRTYIPKTDVRLDLLVHSELTSACPYKGVAGYYDVKLPSGEKRDGLVWWYRNPTVECADIKGYVAFYDEKVDVFVDGVRVDRPSTHF
ncbi:DUF427-domain-containing protein [Auriscalpium vulgare]|uniref:DUF427-domain-containing protein n=1 Tax=Auriscalpium vulgare TaxID=40419 RepID=A0ACB8S4Y1_9AGAM|nr:DUF427-domain-containing protein [Auriscalpium vulgare]